MPPAPILADPGANPPGNRTTRGATSRGDDYRLVATRERIVCAGSGLVHGLASWDWRELTFRAVAAG